MKIFTHIFVRYGFSIIVLCNCSFGYCQGGVVLPEKDKELIGLTKENSYLRKELLKRDSAIKVDNERLVEKISYIEKNINTRFDDARVVIGVIVALLLAIITGSYFKGRNDAIQVAKEEFDKKFKDYETEAVEILGRMKSYENQSSKFSAAFNSAVEKLTKDVDGTRKAVIEKIIDDIKIKLNLK